MTNQLPPTPPLPEQPRDISPVPGSYTAIKQPRLEGRLQLDGAWHQISKKYVAEQILVNIIWMLIIGAGAVVAWVLTGEMWSWLILLALIPALFALVLVPRQARSIGFQLRADDIVFRRGILWQRMVAVPYGRLQLVDITHGPLDRMFGVSQLKLVTAAASTGVTIPGLPPQTAEELRDVLIDVAEERRAGL